MGSEYLDEFSKQLKTKSPPPMPCAEELQVKMFSKLNAFLNPAYYHLNADDVEGIEKFKQRLTEHKKNGYPYCDSLNLIYIFVYIITYLFLRYDKVGEEAGSKKNLKALADEMDPQLSECKELALSISINQLLLIPEQLFGGLGFKYSLCSSADDAFFSMLRRLRHDDSEDACNSFWYDRE